MKMSLTEKQKKIILIYYCINILALLSNLLYLNFNFTFGTDLRFYLFTNTFNESAFAECRYHFWPFIEFYHENGFYGNVWAIWYGIFNSYDFSEFLFYSIIPFAYFGVKRFMQPDKL